MTLSYRGVPQENIQLDAEPDLQKAMETDPSDQRRLEERDRRIQRSQHHESDHQHDKDEVIGKECRDERSKNMNDDS